MADLAALLTERLQPAFDVVAGRPAAPAVRRSRQADFQADGALALARELGRNPRDIAADVVAAAQLDDIAESVEVSGPGFINITLHNETLSTLAAEVASDDRLSVPRVQHPETVVIDYSSPNAAKEMHVGHLRSTIISDAVNRLLEWQGHAVIRQNHLGDWGTPFGMLIEHLLDVGETEAAHELSMGELKSFYQAARAKFDADDAFKERSRQRVVALQGGDPASRRLWELLIRQSTEYFTTVYEKLDAQTTAEDFVGESHYNDQLDDVIAELREKGLLVESEGALCVFPEGFTNRDGDRLPLIVKKRDGAIGYASTDLATIRYRIRDLKGTRLLYVVGLPQQQHFAMIFETAREAGWLAPPIRAEHVGFGSVLGKDGKLLRTRAGESVKLIDLLDEAVARGEAIVAEKNPELDEAERADVARAVGIGAVKYADLSTDRVKDYIFDFDRMLSFDGNTAPYLQYAYARIRSIFRRVARTETPPVDRNFSENAVPRPGSPRNFSEITEGVAGNPGDAGNAGNAGGTTIAITEPAERALVLELLGFEPVITSVSDSLEFHTLANYLYGLATTFMAFYEHCPVLQAEEPRRTSRLTLCDVTARTLATGLHLLGITTPERM